MKKTITEDIKRIKELMFQEEDLEIKEDDVEYEEMTEEGEDATSGESGGGASQGYPSVGVWQSGLTRGPGNPITNAKREDKVARGKANQLK